MLEIAIFSLITFRSCVLVICIMYTLIYGILNLWLALSQMLHFPSTTDSLIDFCLQCLMRESG